MKKRLYLLLVEKGFFDSRSKAQVHILSGEVFVNNEKVFIPSRLVNINVDISIKFLKDNFVSRGGLKLQEALNYFDVNIKEKVCLDVGASTGGFTDCLIRAGAKKVYSVDVGYGQLDFKLRENEKVINIEKFNARYLTRKDLSDKVDLIVMDVSFISITKFEDFFKEFATNDNFYIGLIKPQFELTSNKIGKNGIVKKKEYHSEAIENVRVFLSNFYSNISKEIESPIKGAKGNIEFLIFCKN